ncbi:MAG TPA: TIGR03032 family protein [Gemmataceae bacterium]|nr:TIGR03032 family protein [Gemmataceae bacterium]
MTVLEIDNVTKTPVADPRLPEVAVRPEERGVPATRKIRHEYTPTLPALLNQLGVSLLVSTYQAGKVVAIGVAEGELTLSYHQFERAMGLAVAPDRIAVVSRVQVWFLNSAPALARRVEPVGRHDACFVTRSSHFTGEIQAHELAWSGNELWVVNAAFGCLCTLDDRHSFVPRWRPPFLTALASEDRCHLNGLAMAPDERGVRKPRYVTALGQTDTPQGWRASKVTGGCLIDVASGQTVARGFAMPHSPRVHHNRVWMLHSGVGQLVQVDPSGGRVETVAELPGFTRGLALYDRFAFVGLSKIRKTSTFGGVPIAERRAELKCGVGVVDLGTGRLVARLEFLTGVEEIFDVQVVPGARYPAVWGPYANAGQRRADLDGNRERPGFPES